MALAFRCNNCGALGVYHYPSDDWCKACRDTYALHWRETHRERFLKLHSARMARYRLRQKRIKQGLPPIERQPYTWDEAMKMLHQTEKEINDG